MCFVIDVVQDDSLGGGRGQGSWLGGGTWGVHFNQQCPVMDEEGCVRALILWTGNASWMTEVKNLVPHFLS